MIEVIDYRAGNAPSVMYALEHLGLPARLVERRRPTVRRRRPRHPPRRRRRPRHHRLARGAGPRRRARRTGPRRRRAVPRHLHRAPGAVRPQRGGRHRTASGGSPARCGASPTPGRVPQIGWNAVRVHPRPPGHARRCPVRGHFYFVNSYYCVAERPGRRAGRHRVRPRVLLDRRARQHRRDPVPRREERRARSRAPAQASPAGNAAC